MNPFSSPYPDNYDVIVAGGGPAGFTAAISAARAGLRTALVEKLAFFGGTATAGYVVPISGFFHQGQRVIGGIAWEMVERLQAMHAAQCACDTRFAARTGIETGGAGTARLFRKGQNSLFRIQQASVWNCEESPFHVSHRQMRELQACRRRSAEL